MPKITRHGGPTIASFGAALAAARAGDDIPKADTAEDAPGTPVFEVSAAVRGTVIRAEPAAEVVADEPKPQSKRVRRRTTEAEVSDG